GGRAMSRAGAPACITQPHTTSSTISGSTPARCTRALSTCAASSAGCTPDRPPFRLPTGDRTASTITASGIGSSLGKVRLSARLCPCLIRAIEVHRYIVGPGLAGDHVRHPHLTPFELAGRRLDQPV